MEVVAVDFNSKNKLFILTAVEVLTLPILGMQSGESPGETQLLGQPDLHLMLVFSTRNTESVIIKQNSG